MASIRDRIVGAAIVELNTGTPGGVPQSERVRLTEYAPGDLPAIVVFPSRDIQREVGGRGGPVYKSELTLVVEMRAKGTPATKADQAVDALYVWVSKTLSGKRLPDGAGGFFNHTIVEGDTTFAFEQGTEPYCLAATEFVVHYQRLLADPEARV